MTDDELLDALREALDEADQRAARLRLAIAAFGDNLPIETTERGQCFTCGTDGELVDGLCIDGCTPAKAKPPAKRTPAKRTSRDVSRGPHFVCPECGQRFSRPNGLTRHLNQTHGGRRVTALVTEPPATNGDHAEALPDVPSGLGSIERRPFDPERARLAAVANAYDDQLGKL